MEETIVVTNLSAVEDKIRKYYEDKIIENALKSKLDFYDRHKGDLPEASKIEVNIMKRKVYDLEFKYKALELMIARLNDNDQDFLKFKYKDNLPLKIIAPKLSICVKTCTRKKTILLNYLKECLNEQIG
jgi:DNA-directed RNA polymerase specialized sigma subunit